MAARGSKSTHQARTQAERARLHSARKAWHHGVIRRRVRDNTVAGIVGGLIIAAAIASQFAHAQLTAPEPTPTPTPTVAPVETPGPGTTPSPGPTPTGTPAE